MSLQSCSYYEFVKLKEQIKKSFDDEIRKLELSIT